MTVNGKGIWILNHYATTPDIPGGTRCYSLGQGLREHGYDVTIFASSFVHLLHREIRLAKGECWATETVNGLRYVWLRTFPYRRNSWRRAVNMLSYLWASYRIGRSSARLIPGIAEPSTIVGSSVHLLAALSAYLLARHFDAHFVMEIRDVWPQALVDMGKLSERSVVTWAMRWFERWLYQRADRVIVLLPGAVDHVANLGVSRDRIVHIPNGVDLSLFPQAVPRTEQDNGLRVVFLGSFGLSNNLDTLLDAIRLVQDRGYQNIRFDLIGDGTLKARLVTRSRELALRNTRFHKAVPRTQVPQVLSQADVAVCMSANVLRYGISARKLFDYMASARPIIFSGDTPNDIVQSARCGLSVPLGDAQKLANAIIRLHRMPLEERRAMGQQGRAYVEKHHDHSMLALRLVEMVGELENGAME
jgi:glycosyltransferase involved in cell wall biosynthesis